MNQEADAANKQVNGIAQHISKCSICAQLCQFNSGQAVRATLPCNRHLARPEEVLLHPFLGLCGQDFGEGDMGRSHREAGAAVKWRVPAPF